MFKARFLYSSYLEGEKNWILANLYTRVPLYYLLTDKSLRPNPCKVLSFKGYKVDLWQLSEASHPLHVNVRWEIPNDWVC